MMLRNKLYGRNARLDSATNTEHFMTIGELAKHAHVTVRTLQYYDQQGLLSPSATDNQNHRLYSESDVEELYQILILKFLGMTLSEIKEHKDELKNVPAIRMLANKSLQSIEKQISEQLKTMTQLRELIEYASLTMGSGAVDWQKIASFLEKKQEQPDLFWRLISVQDSSDPATTDIDTTRKKQQNEQWHGLIAQIIRLMEHGVDPASEEARRILVQYQDILKDSWERDNTMPDFLLMGSQVMGGAAGDTFEKLTQQVGSYLQAALDTHKDCMERGL